MNVQRLAPTQLLTDVPLEVAREATWFALQSEGVGSLVIDPNKNLVVGSTGANLTTYGQAITVAFESRPDGTLISLRSEAQVQGTIDFGKSKRHAEKMTTAIDFYLRRGDLPVPMQVDFAPAPPMAPIASPEGPPVAPVNMGPVYGMAMPPKRGTAVLIYGLLGVTCCQIAAPFAWVYGSKALKEYGDNDPGDKTVVKIGWILGMIGCAILLLRIGIIITAAMNN